jgi:hypothetical protein
MKRAWAILILAALGAAGQAKAPGRWDVGAVEKLLDDRVRRAFPESPMHLLGNTRGVYLEGYGAVFTVEFGLIMTPALSPFRQEVSAEEKSRIHAAKLKRLPEVKSFVRDFMVNTAASMDALPAGENFVVGVSLVYQKFEERGQLPDRMVFSAQKGKLVDVAASRVDRAQLESIVKVREY